MSAALLPSVVARSPLDDPRRDGLPVLALATLGGIDAHGALDFRQMIEQAEIGICITQDACFQYVNRKFAEMHGYAVGQMQGMPLSQLVHPEESERVAHIRRLRDLGCHHAAYESRNLHRDGSTVDVRIFGRAIQYRGRLANLVTASDISELVHAHHLSEWRARMLVSNELLCNSGSIEIELASRQVLLSAGAQVLIDAGGQTGRLSLLAALRCVPAEERAAVLARWRYAKPGQAFELRHSLMRWDGSLRRVLHRGLIEPGEGGAADRPVAILQDITEQTEAHAQIERLRNYHPVTGLATRARLLERSAAAIEMSRQEGHPLAMLYLRVPALDRVHDALGLRAGDVLAATLADRLLNACHDGDTTAHLADGEFAVLFDPANGVDEAQVLNAASRILAALEAPTTIAATDIAIDGRIGIAMFPGDAQTPDALLENARAACGSTDSGVCFFTREVGEQAARRIKLEAGLCRAFERRELSLHYQPQVDLRDGSVVGVEALLRWKSDEFGQVSPDEFVPIAEEAGLIVAMGEWVFRTACEQSVEWARLGLPQVRISVNLSPLQLEQPDISQRLQSMILETGADPMHLGIEVTESMLMRDLEAARRTLNELSAIGVEIALDDFGTGYSNLSVLRALPFDVLKIDRSLVHDVTAAPEDVSITRAVLMLAQGLKIKVLAEGVETEGQLNLLISNGCEFMQGYIFSRPVPAEAMKELLREGRRLPDEFLNRAARRRTLLLVDDEDNVVSSLRRLLRGDGYHVVVARSGQEGLARLAEHNVDVIVSDQRMPGMTGVEFLRQAKELYPDTVRIVLSGYTELQTITDAVNEGAIYKFLTKPWDDDRLRAHIAEAFRRKELFDDNRRLATEVRNANQELANANERQEHLLARQREQLSLEACRALNAQDLLENLPTSVIGIDADGDIAFANRQARALFGVAQPLLGCAAELALPAEWLQARHCREGRHRRVSFEGRGFQLSCAEMSEPGTERRGHLLSFIPDHEPPEPDARRSAAP